MATKTRIVRIGNSRGIRIPKTLPAGACHLPCWPRGSRRSPAWSSSTGRASQVSSMSMRNGDLTEAQYAQLLQQLPPGVSPRPFDPSRPSLFTALDEQLGVRLDSSTGPIDVIVIDSVTRQAAIEQKLLAEGYQLARLVSDRRSAPGTWHGSDRRRGALIIPRRVGYSMSDTLFWSKRGDVGCRSHAPDPRSERWQAEGWCPIPESANRHHRLEYQCPRCAPDGRSYRHNHVVTPMQTTLRDRPDDVRTRTRAVRDRRTIGGEHHQDSE